MSLLRTAVLVPAAVGALLLAGCTGGADGTAPTTVEPIPTDEAASDQSVEEACAILAAGSRDFVELSQRDDLPQFAATDPEGALDQLELAAATFSDAVVQVTEPEVLQVAAAADGAMTGYVAYVRDLLDDPANVDVEELNARMDGMTQSFGAIGTVCG
ncbi:hypothetical protein [Agromyces sp. SYSU T0242]|uniref:hypothetical protein n=1 Tax=Agromyces litoreus TaxID=3158561 RepID=UPI003398870A